MRLRSGVTCATMTCAGAAIALGGLASCVSSSNNPAGPGEDASLFDAAQPDAGVTLPVSDATTDTTLPIVDSGPGSDATDSTLIDTGVDSAAAVDAADAAMVDAADAAANDAGTDASPIVDSGFDAADSADSAPTCAPGSVTGFTPPPYVPAQTQNIICNNADDMALAQACLGDASTLQGCSTFATTGEDGGVAQNCATCLLTPEVNEAGTYGPAIVGSVTVPNLAGCIQLADQSDAGYACAVSIQAAWRCTELACATNCPVTDDPSRNAYFSCVQTAGSTVCSAYTAVANACIAAELDAGNQANPYCVGLAGTSADQFANIALFFCSS